MTHLPVPTAAVADVAAAVGTDPLTLADTLASADRAYLFAALAGLLGGAITLALGAAAPAAPAEDTPAPDLVAYSS